MSDQEKDPVVHSSLSKQLFIWSVLLVLSLIWGLWDEIYGTRPWKGYEARFQKAYSSYLARAKGGQTKSTKQGYRSRRPKRRRARASVAKR